MDGTRLCPKCSITRGMDTIAPAPPGLVWMRCSCGHRWLRTVRGVSRQDLPEESGSYVGDVEATA